MGCEPRVIVQPSVTEVVVKDVRPHTQAGTSVAKVVRVGSEPKAVRAETTGNIVVSEEKKSVVELGIPGPKGERGPAGPPGPAAGATISGEDGVEVEYSPDESSVVISLDEPTRDRLASAVVAANPATMGDILEYDGAGNWVAKKDPAQLLIDGGNF